MLTSRNAQKIFVNLFYIDIKSGRKNFLCETILFAVEKKKKMAKFVVLTLALLFASAYSQDLQCIYCESVMAIIQPLYVIRANLTTITEAVVADCALAGQNERQVGNPSAIFF
jgi:hypothetical protein